MFSVLFEVLPKADQWDAYLDYAKMLRPELEQVDGFIDNTRYRSLTRDGLLLSVSNWRDEKALVRWRTKMRHHEVQELGRNSVLLDYHLRVGQVTHDTQVPQGNALQEQRLDETQVGEATTITLIDAKQPAEWTETNSAAECAEWLGLSQSVAVASWDVFDAVLSPGALVLMMTWASRDLADESEPSLRLPDGARCRRIRIVRDYGMYDRREAPQYYPDAPNQRTLH